jgi:molybdopterin biosynthesis enzyme
MPAQTSAGSAKMSPTGATLVQAGSLLDTRHVALLAACGINKVQVTRRVKIAVIDFRNKLHRPGARIQEILRCPRCAACAWTAAHRFPEWLPARSGFQLQRQPGFTEVFPARIRAGGAGGMLTVERLGKGGSARLRPLVEADGLGRLDEALGPIEPGDGMSFLPFTSILG